MKREIKFRFWRDGKMHQAHQLNAYEENNFSGDGEILMQYTGLKDKHGKEIYEGDVLKFPFEMGIGFVVNDGFRFAIESPGSHAVDYESKEVLESAEIIGNIYENPELIKEEQ